MAESQQTVQLESTEDIDVVNLPNYRDSNGDASVSRRSTPGTPRWVKVFGIIIVGLVLLFAVLHLTGHGPMNHMPSTQQEMQMP